MGVPHRSKPPTGPPIVACRWMRKRTAQRDAGYEDGRLSMADDELTKYKAKQASAWLNEVLAQHRRVDALKERAESMRAGLDGLRSPGVQVRVSGGGCSDDRMAEGIAKLQEAINDYCTELLALMDMQDEARSALYSMDDNATPLMVYHYILGKKWHDAAKMAGLEYTSAMHANRRALAKLYDLMPHRYRDPLHPAI